VNSEVVIAMTSLTVALGINAPVESLTVPEMMAVISCGNA